MSNTSKKTRLELLAPAKNLESGRAAILAGADAVYIGGPDFGARSAASNSWEDIKALVDFGHQYYARVYVALNTIFFDNEKTAVEEAINKACEISVDALIIQDLGILEMDLPPIPLFASTQTNNYDLERIKFLAEAGFERIILARELSLEEIGRIKKELGDIELECFVHGALCVSYSGQCYLSQYLSGRSANRGRCMQACRLPFDLVDANGKILAQNKYLLSLKDLNNSENISALAEAGVTSFKIEGRLKDKSYVVNAVASYRKILDELIKKNNHYIKSSSGREVIGFTPDLKKGFNRGFTDYYLHGRGEEVISPLNQKSIGRLVGRVENVGRGFFTLDCEHDLENGDGLCWFVADELTGININKVENGNIYPARPVDLRVGDEIYCNQDLSFEKEIEKTERKIVVDFYVYENEDGFTLRIIDEDNNEIKKKFIVEIQSAKTAEAEEIWKKQLSRLGETIFYARDFKFEWSEPRFAPASVLNDWRRELIGALFEERLKKYPRQKRKSVGTGHCPFQILDGKILDYSYNIDNNLAKNFYEKQGAEVKEMAVEKTLDCRNKKLMTTKHCLKYWLGACNKRGDKSEDFSEPLYLVHGNKKFRLSFDCDRCEMNIWSE